MTWHAARNFASTTVASGALNNTTSPITISVAVGANLGSTWPMWATVDPSGTPEVVEITARTGDSITMTRATPVAHAGTPVIVCTAAAEYVAELQAAVDLKAALAGPAFTGNPTATTQSPGNNSTRLATTAYVDAAVAASPSQMVLIQEQIVSGSVAANVTFSGISGSYRALHLFVVGRSNDAAIAVNLEMILNADTGSNYDMVREDDGAGAVKTTAQTKLALGAVSAGGALANAPGINEIALPFYADTTFLKTILNRGGGHWSSGTIANYRSWGMWRSTSAITSIKLQPSAGSFVVGSRFALYGIV